MPNTISNLTAENQTFYDRALLERLIPELHFYKDAKKKKIPKGKGTKIEWRIFKSLAIPTTPLTEGVTPSGSNLDIAPVTAECNQYGDYVTVSDVLDMSFIETSELREQSKGLLNGVLRTEADKEYHELLNNVTVDTIYPEGESLRDLYNKMLVYIEKIKEMEDDTLLITHRGVINMIYYILYGKELDMNKKQFGVETASVHEFNVEENVIRRIR